MAISSVAFNAYKNAMDVANKSSSSSAFNSHSAKKGDGEKTNFAETINESIQNVNDLQTKKADMIESFASGETQNVHELMISLQKASVAMSMTSAVRNKVMETYKELMRMTF